MAMLNPRCLAAGLVLVLLTSCSAIQFGYGKLPTLAYWWLDSYIDFSSKQSPKVHEQLNALHDWHRSSELPAYAQTLRKMQTLAPRDVTPQQICGLWAEVQTHIHHMGEAAAGTISAVLPDITANQIQNLTHQFDKRNIKWREEWLDLKPAELLAHRFDVSVERTTELYAHLSDSQRALLRDQTAHSSFDVQLAWRERLRRQQDMLQVLQLHAGSPAADPARAAQIKADVLALLDRLQYSPDPQYRAQQEKVAQENCAALAALHNSASPSQRAKLLDSLRRYERHAIELAQKN